LGVTQSFQNILSGKSFVTKIPPELANFGKPMNIQGLEELIGGHVEMDEEKLKAEMGEMYEKMGRKDLFMYLAAQQALKDGSWNPEDPSEKERTGMVVSSASKNLHEVAKFMASLTSNPNPKVDDFPKYFLSYLGVPALHVGLEHNFNGPTLGVGAAGAGGVFTSTIASQFIRDGEADVMLCGGGEAPISALFTCALHRMRAHCSASSGFPPESRVRPFDMKRTGTAMCEGAAVLLLESYEHAKV
jgi:3-oxoacyl-[acyl-carrier-protein] synthase II